MDQVAIDLQDDMTLGSLRRLAQAMGKRLVIGFESGARRGRPPGRPRAAAKAAPAPAVDKAPRRKKRKMSPEGRAALARNLAKARAARAAKLKAAAKKGA